MQGLEEASQNYASATSSVLAMRLSLHSLSVQAEADIVSDCHIIRSLSIHQYFQVIQAITLAKHKKDISQGLN